MQRRCAAPRSGARAAQLCATCKNSTPCCCREPYEVAVSTACGDSLFSRAGAPTSPFFDQRIKLSFASEPNSVSFYCLQRHGPEGPLLGTSSGGSVTGVQFSFSATTQSFASTSPETHWAFSVVQKLAFSLGLTEASFPSLGEGQNAQNTSNSPNKSCFFLYNFSPFISLGGVMG